MPSRLCKTCNHPKPFHGRQLNIPSLPYIFKDGECCYGAKGRRVKVSKTKWRKLVSYVLQRYKSGYKVSSRTGVGKIIPYRKESNRGMIKLQAENTVRNMMNDAFPSSLTAREEGNVGMKFNNQLWVCGCKEFK